MIRRVAFCPHCSNRAPQRLIHTQEHPGKGYSTDGTLLEDSVPCAYHVAVCETCNEILLYHAYFTGAGDKEFHLADLIWPDPGVLPVYVPKAVAECYQEAAIVKNLAPNAFAVQIRRALEALCDDRGAKKGPLAKRLQDLASRGEIPPVLVKMTDVLRILGNIGAHATEQSVKPGHVYAIDDFFRAIIEYVYVAPSKLKVFRNTLKHLRNEKNISNNV